MRPGQSPARHPNQWHSQAAQWPLWRRGRDERSKTERKFTTHGAEEKKRKNELNAELNDRVMGKICVF